MAEARTSDQWNHTAMICVLTANIHRDRKTRKRPFELADFHPGLKRVRRKSSAVYMLSMLSAIDGSPPEVVTENSPWLQNHQT